MKLDRERTVLIVIDVQEAFRKALPDFDDVAAATAKLVRGASTMGIPVIVTEQYPKGLGETVPEVAEHLPDGTEAIDKVCFSAADADGFDLGGRDQALVCGIEAHVCVNQSVLDLIDRGVQTYVAADAVGSRTKRNAGLGLHRMEEAGATATSVEMALFELLRGSDAPEFKQVQGLIK